MFQYIFPRKQILNLEQRVHKCPDIVCLFYALKCIFYGETDLSFSSDEKQVYGSRETLHAKMGTKGIFHVNIKDNFSIFSNFFSIFNIIFFNIQCKYQGNISCKDGHNKGQNGMDLTETEDIKKRQQEYTEELYKKKILMIQITIKV